MTRLWICLCMWQSSFFVLVLLCTLFLAWYNDCIDTARLPPPRIVKMSVISKEGDLLSWFCNPLKNDVSVYHGWSGGLGWSVSQVCYVTVEGGRKWSIQTVTKGEGRELKTLNWALRVRNAWTFRNNMNQICTKLRANSETPAQIASFLNKAKRKLLIHGFFKYQFSYNLLSWMFYSRKLNNKINRLYERSFGIWQSSEKVFPFSW